MARAYIMQIGASREIIYGVSPKFAMTKMDDYPQHECDLYVEDVRAQLLLTEILVEHDSTLIERCQIVPYGAASVGKALGQMVVNKKWPRPSVVYLDGDQGLAPGCVTLPGDDAPERVIFAALKARDWKGIPDRVGREHSKVADACARVMVSSNHHEWVDDAATKLILAGDTLWQAMCAEWAKELPKSEARKVTQPIDDALIGVIPTPEAVTRSANLVPITPLTPASLVPAHNPQQRHRAEKVNASSETLPLFARLPDVPEE